MNYDAHNYTSEPRKSHRRHASLENIFSELSPSGTIKAPSINFEFLYNSLINKIKNKSEMNHINFVELCRFPLFGKLADDGLDMHSLGELFCKSKTAVFEEGTEIFEYKNHEIDRVYVVLSGRIVVAESLPHKESIGEILTLSNVSAKKNRSKSISVDYQGFLPMLNGTPNAKELGNKKGSSKNFFKISNPVTEKQPPKEAPKNFINLELIDFEPNTQFLNEGQSFGEGKLQSPNGVLVAMSKCKVFYVLKKDLEDIKKTYSIQELNEKLPTFLMDHIPGLASFKDYELAKSISSLFIKAKILRGNKITKELDHGKTIYLLKKGEVSAYLASNTGKSQQGEEFVYISPGHFIGDELIFTGDPHYKWSTKVTSAKATIYYMPVDQFINACPKSCLELLSQVYSKKLISWKKLEEKKKGHHEVNDSHKKSTESLQILTNMMEPTTQPHPPNQKTSTIKNPSPKTLISTKVPSPKANLSIKLHSPKSNISSMLGSLKSLTPSSLMFSSRKDGDDSPPNQVNDEYNNKFKRTVALPGRRGSLTSDISIGVLSTPKNIGLMPPPIATPIVAHKHEKKKLDTNNISDFKFDFGNEPPNKRERLLMAKANSPTHFHSPKITASQRLAEIQSQMHSPQLNVRPKTRMLESLAKPLNHEGSYMASLFGGAKKSHDKPAANDEASLSRINNTSQYGLNSQEGTPKNINKNQGVKHQSFMAMKLRMEISREIAEKNEK